MIDDDDDHDDDDYHGSGRSRRHDPWTSKKAGDEVDATALGLICLNALKTAPISGLTTHEIARLTGLEYGSVTPRMIELEAAGLVERARDANDEVMTRIPAGRRKPGIIWRLRQTKRPEFESFNPSPYPSTSPDQD